MSILDESVLWIETIFQRLLVLAAKDSELRLCLSFITHRMQDLQLENSLLDQVLRLQIPFQQQLEHALLCCSLLTRTRVSQESTDENMIPDGNRSIGCVSNSSTECNFMWECAACGATHRRDQRSPGRRYGELCRRCDGTHLVIPEDKTCSQPEYNSHNWAL